MYGTGYILTKPSNKASIVQPTRSYFHFDNFKLSSLYSKLEYSNLINLGPSFITNAMAQSLADSVSNLEGDNIPPLTLEHDTNAFPDAIEKDQSGRKKLRAQGFSVWLNDYNRLPITKSQKRSTW